MTKRMLIDTTHAEETRVVVMDGNRLEDYDVETSAKKQLKGNIYLAKVIRVEPSLQAAFVEYGGNRHGFLAFSEIHPDYYQIPVADREKLLALQEEEARAEEARNALEDEAEASEAPAAAQPEDGAAIHAEAGDEDELAPAPEIVGGEHDTGDESAAQRRTARFLRNYKIQEVIRRRQVLLVQVVKEERGNKGAALTTYVSLAGRYCVLMPNALRGGGVSRKITSVSDRKRLREAIAELQLPRGMAMIVRTAGAQRPRPEIIRDCEYLLHLWDDIREHTLQSVAPTLVYEEASLIKRAIRDVYTRDVEDILVDGEAAWKSAREFMRMLMPHNVQKVQLWRDNTQSLFSHFQVEGHLDAMFSPTAQLRSGGYIVINQTEALVSIDVNSGRSTRERNIEETALRTNLEAADEVARQLRLRDLAGLVVIDFIDMESRKHNAMVERRVKEALRSDRARIQIGQISHFGLLEMSRQRLRPSIAESVFTTCPHCQGTGIIRGTESAALHVLRAIEEEGTRRKAAEITVNVAGSIALYILNHKRSWLAEIEKRHRMVVVFIADDSLLSPQFRIERIRAQADGDFVEHASQPIQHDRPEAQPQSRPAQAVREISITHEAPVIDAEDALSEAEPAPQGAGETPAPANETAVEGEERRKRRRRRRRRGARREAQPGDVAEADLDADGEDEGEDEAGVETDASPVPQATPAETDDRVVPGRRRTRHARQPDHVAETRKQESAPAPAPYRGPTPANPFGEGFDIFDVIERNGRAAARPAAAPAPVVELPTHDEPVIDAPAIEAPVVAKVTVEAVEAEPAAKPARRRATRKPAAPAAVEPEPTPVIEAPVEEKPKRRTRAAAKATTKAEPEAVTPKPAARRTRKAAPAEAPVTETVVEAETAATPARTRGAAKSAKPAAKSKVVQPQVIEDTPAPANRRTGWWRR